MHRLLCTVAVATVSMFAATGTALASDDPVPPAFAPPVVAPVTDNDTAAAFAKNYAANNAARFLGQRRRNVRVIDSNAACLTSPFVATRWGCVFTLRALVIQRRSHGWDGWGHNSRYSSRRGHRPRFRIRNYGCIGGLSINGGPAVTPTAQLRFVECGRVPRGDIEAPEPAPTDEPTDQDG